MYEGSFYRMGDKVASPPSFDSSDRTAWDIFYVEKHYNLEYRINK